MDNKNILLVDDERPILEALGSYLERNALNVRKAISGEDAVSELDSNTFDLVITDLVMEGVDGIEVLKKTKEKSIEIPVFILTGQGNMEMAIEALRHGAEDFLLKPCDVDELVRKIKKCFRQQEATKLILERKKLLAVCMYCKKVRDDDSCTNEGDERWLRLEDYLLQKTGLCFTHGCCLECFEEYKGLWGGGK